MPLCWLNIDYCTGYQFRLMTTFLFVWCVYKGTYTILYSRGHVLYLCVQLLPPHGGYRNVRLAAHTRQLEYFLYDNGRFKHAPVICQ